MKDSVSYSSRRKPLRSFLHLLSILALDALAEVQIIGQENIPKDEPLLVVGNHFSFIDPVAFVRIFSWQLEFVGGAEMPNAPKVVRFIPSLWGYYPLFRGTGARGSLKAAEHILSRGGKLGIFPEGGNWATILRYARPGTAYLATRTGARILPVGLSGLDTIFPLKLGKRPRVVFRIGKPFGPFQVHGRGRERRRQLNEIGHEIMRHIAELLPPEKRGVYSCDPERRAAAEAVAHYPWDDAIEGKVQRAAP